jgi:hypothetical protein
VGLRPGYVDARDVPGPFADVDAIVLPFRTATASFNVSLAFEHGVPVIATHAGTLAQDVVDGINGVVCKAGDVDALADAPAPLLCRRHAQQALSRCSAGESGTTVESVPTALLKAAGIRPG